MLLVRGGVDRLRAGRLTGNPVDLMLPEDATPEDRAHLLQALGLDGPSTSSS